MHRTLLLAGLAAWLVSAAPAAAQEPGRFQVAPLVGGVVFAEESALENAPFLGLDASYFVTRNFAIGLTGLTARVKTDGSFFPLVLMDFGDTTYVYSVAQQTTLVSAGAHVQAHLPMDRIDLYATAGGGVYRFYMDPRRTQTVTRSTGGTLLLGGGVSYNINPRVGVRLDARDMMLLSYDRNDFDATVDYVRNDRIPDIAAAPPEAKETVHNLRFALGFSFIPGASR